MEAYDDILARRPSSARIRGLQLRRSSPRRRTSRQEPDGAVGDPKVTAEMPEAYRFADAAIKVFPKWKFTPQIVNGATSPTKAYFPFSFKLR